MPTTWPTTYGKTTTRRRTYDDPTTPNDERNVWDRVADFATGNSGQMPLAPPAPPVDVPLPGGRFSDPWYTVPGWTMGPNGWTNPRQASPVADPKNLQMEYRQGRVPPPGPEPKQFAVPQSYRMAGFPDDPQTFYAVFQGVLADPNLSPLDKATTIASWQSAADTNQKKLDAQTAAIDELRGTQRTTQAAYDQFRTDPTRQAIVDALTMRSANTYNAISPIEEAAARNSLNQQASANQSAIQNQAASSGMLHSGIYGVNSQTANAVAAAAGQQLTANITRANEEARRGALTALSGVGNAYNQLDLGYLGQIDRGNTELARVTRDVNYQPTDFAPLAALSQGNQRYAEESAKADHYLGETIAATQPQLLDWANFALTALGPDPMQGLKDIRKWIGEVFG